MTLEWGNEIEVELEITPEPTLEERAAIEATLEALRKPAATGGKWWSAGLSESLEEDED